MDRTILGGCAALLASALVCNAAAASGDCEGAVLDNWSGTGTVACPCFVAGEQVGAVFAAPPEHYPLVVDSVSILWGSLFGSPPATEEAIHLYAGGLPAPGAPIASIENPMLIDGEFNVFLFDGDPAARTITSGPFMVALEFRIDSDILRASPIHDGAGCAPGRNAVFAIPGGWTDACELGVTGNWYLRVSYTSVCATCPEDLDASGTVDVSDLLVVLANWGGPGGDVDGDGTTTVSDLLNVLASWGPC